MRSLWKRVNDLAAQHVIGYMRGTLMKALVATVAQLCRKALTPAFLSARLVRIRKLQVGGMRNGRTIRIVVFAEVECR